MAVIMKAIRSTNNKDSNAYKATEYYNDLINDILDDERKFVRPIEKYDYFGYVDLDRISQNP
jgi:hypothetical protein